ncbi:hypothetical protein THASP1DRAFT_32252 [Thamnocephalis sphaerospora]|uniref:Uncharacterized protein n=1 Tax=Thamnocephalis sphaerospora TaxID=78915 RepID=A0A4P9XJI8_9FUNG|nr:hypothetical protein THASP1DRAFT_32252 [Thamnocephalis sphaerospora]|eukprot:RKP05922.1 hypothetical protein THASP1DRAFT_32252 [Thamnocephalis sphaerospora]
MHGGLESAGHKLQLCDDMLMACAPALGFHSYVWSLPRLEAQFHGTATFERNPLPATGDSPAWLLRSRAHHHFLGIGHLQLVPTHLTKCTEYRILLCKHLLSPSTYRWALVIPGQTAASCTAMDSGCCKAPFFNARLVMAQSFDDDRCVLVACSDTSVADMLAIFSFISNDFVWTYSRDPDPHCAIIPSHRPTEDSDSIQDIISWQASNRLLSIHRCYYKVFSLHHNGLPKQQAYGRHPPKRLSEHMYVTGLTSMPANCDIHPSQSVKAADDVMALNIARESVLGCRLETGISSETLDMATALGVVVAVTASTINFIIPAV